MNLGTLNTKADFFFNNDINIYCKRILVYCRRAAGRVEDIGEVSLNRLFSSRRPANLIFASLAECQKAIFCSLCMFLTFGEISDYYTTIVCNSNRATYLL